MVQNYTQESLVRFIYRETTVCEHFEIQDAIENDPTLKKQFKALFEAFKNLPKVVFSPSRNCIEQILNYNKNSNKAYC